MPPSLEVLCGASGQISRGWCAKGVSPDKSRRLSADPDDSCAGVGLWIQTFDFISCRSESSNWYCASASPAMRDVRSRSVPRVAAVAIAS